MMHLSGTFGLCREPISHFPTGVFSKFRGRKGIPNGDEEIYTHAMPGENVRIFACSGDDLWHVMLIVRTAYAEVKKATGERGFPRYELQFLLPEEKNPSDPQPFNLREYAVDETPLHASARLDELTYEILRSLLWRKFNDYNKKRQRLGNPSSAAVDFVAAGLCNRIVYDGKGGNGAYTQDYRIANLTLKRGIFPNVEWLLTRPAPAKNQILFRLYAVHCDLLLHCLERSGRLPVILDRYWSLLAKNSSSASEALASALKIPWKNGKALQSWYERSALENSCIGRQTLAQEDVARQLEEALVIPVLSAESVDAIRKIPLEEVPELLKNYRLDLNAITELQQRLMQFRRSSSPLLWGALEEINSAIEMLRKGDYRDFQQKLADARKHFQDAMKRQREIEALLNDAERATGSNGDLVVDAAWLDILEYMERNQSW